MGIHTDAEIWKSAVECDALAIGLGLAEIGEVLHGKNGDQVRFGLLEERGSRMPIKAALAIYCAQQNWVIGQCWQQLLQQFPVRRHRAYEQNHVCAL